MAVAPSNPLRLAPEDLESIIERALEEARPSAASQAEAAAARILVFRRCATGQSETWNTSATAAWYHVYFGSARVPRAPPTSSDAVRATVAKACSIARFPRRMPARAWRTGH